jgi:gamma-glutamylaminecyclotransferase
VLERARFVGEGQTEPVFDLVDLGAYPAIVVSDRGTAVRGELYVVDERTLARVDELEGHPRYYRRQHLTLADGRTAETYLLPASEARGCPVIASGDWRQRSRARQ